MSFPASHLCFDNALLDALSAAAVAAPRLRSHRNLHTSIEEPVQRLLIGIEPGSYVVPHRHLRPGYDETLLILRGSLGVLVFDDDGRVRETMRLVAGGSQTGYHLPSPTWHSVCALQPGTVCFEVKPGPYRPLADGERAPWAPAESDAGTAAFLDGMLACFRD
ncbi:MAG: WbuC family cupin fold metalloprotein [Moraxellaceae bacterium]|nr:WbuC family cupin fold metalloprotein [Moraxellaceae bacterium]